MNSLYDSDVNIYHVDAVRDGRWQRFVDQHPRASIFHTSAWLNALKQTYGYEPTVFTSSSANEEIKDGVVCCRVESWITGRRLVSLPFSDHCEPLVDTSQKFGAILKALRGQRERVGLKYVELRPVNFDVPTELGYVQSAKFYIHKLNLAPSLDELFRAFHKSSVQRKIQRAEREGLTCEEGRSQLLLRQFYRLLLRTRRRHSLPPQPWAWFHNLAAAMQDRMKIRIAFRDRVPIAGILTLADKKTIVYKYGASDERFHNLGAMQMLFWRAIQETKAAGYSELDLGRSDLSDKGLITFKDRLGSTRSVLSYFRYPPQARSATANHGLKIAGHICRHLPLSVLPTVGKVVYRHLG